MDKKAAEEQARKAKDNTGRALFESGKWRDDDSEADSDDEDDPWNLEKLRRETEALRQKKEEERLKVLQDGGLVPVTVDNTPEGADDDNSPGEAGDDVTGEASSAAQTG